MSTETQEIVVAALLRARSVASNRAIMDWECAELVRQIDEALKLIEESI